MKLTEWFPSGVKPARRGVYEVESIFGGRGFAYFNGRIWGWRRGTVIDATLWKNRDDASQDKRWRGLAEKP